MVEHTRIAKYFAPLTASEPGAFSLGDDAAVLAPPAGQSLVITTDSVIEGTHVLPCATPQQFAQKLIRRNLSDLAAIGAAPWRYLLNLHTPRGMSDNWFALFAAALRAEQEHFGLVLAGGDSTSGDGPIHTTMTCLGLINGTPLRRNDAQIGDDIYVSGTVGDAAYALHLLQHNQTVSSALAARYHVPEPRLALGQKLRGVTNAAIDISDGLMADLIKICQASHVGAKLLREALPLSRPMQQAVQQNPENWRFAFNGGDDYELLFTANLSQRSAIQSLAIALNLPLTPIGTITEDDLAITLLDATGAIIPVEEGGWEHR